MISLRRTLLIVSLLAITMAASCSSCDSCGTEQDDDSATDGPDTVAAPDAAEDTRAEDLEEATEQAEELADSAAFDVQQNSRMLAAELEGMQKKVEGPSVKGAGGPATKDEGKIDVAAVQKIFKTKQSNLQKCYERALKRDPALQGQVVMTVRIGRSGKPTLVKARSQAINDPAALNCMEREANTWSFPRPEGGTVMLNKPFRFTPSN
ncbi:MAG: AgmX/PglI C-terminal domain-containing protein [Persicimonas sp.]